MGRMKDIDISAHDWLEQFGWPKSRTVAETVRVLKKHAQQLHDAGSIKRHILLPVEVAGGVLLAVVQQDPDDLRDTRVAWLLGILDGSPGEVVSQLGWIRLPGESAWHTAAAMAA